MIKENKNVCIHTNMNNTSKFIYGRIICADNEFFATSTLSPDGDFDGVLIKKTDDIIYLEIDSQYDDKMSKLFSSNPIVFTKKLEQGNIPCSMLSIALKMKQVVSLELINSGIIDIVGLVISIDNNICTIQQIDEYGFKNGMAYVDISDISQISYASQDEMRIAKLFGKSEQEDRGRFSVLTN